MDDIERIALIVSAKILHANAGVIGLHHERLLENVDIAAVSKKIMEMAEEFEQKASSD